MEPWSASVLRKVGSCVTFWIAAASLSTTACGVAADANTPFQSVTSNPGSTSPTAGTLGRRDERPLVVTPSARSLPLSMNGSTSTMGENTAWIWPPIRSALAGAPPL